MQKGLQLKTAKLAKKSNTRTDKKHIYYFVSRVTQTRLLYYTNAILYKHYIKQTSGYLKKIEDHGGKTV